MIDTKNKERGAHTHTHRNKNKKGLYIIFCTNKHRERKNNEIHSTLTHIVIKREAHTHIHTKRQKKREIIYNVFVQTNIKRH